MKLKKGQQINIKRETLEELQDNICVLLRCSVCGKIHTTYQEEDHYLDEYGFIVCHECIDTNEWHYTFDFDYNNKGERIYPAHGIKWDSNLGEYIHHDKIFDQIVAI